MQFGLRTLLFVMLLLGMLVLSYPLLFKRSTSSATMRLPKPGAKQEKLEALAGAMQDNANMSAEIDKLRTAIAFLESKLPKETEMDRVLQDVWKAAKDNNLNIKTVRNAKPIEGASYSRAADPHGRGRPLLSQLLQVPCLRRATGPPHEDQRHEDRRRRQEHQRLDHR